MHVLYHAQHLYSPKDVDWLLDSEVTSTWSHYAKYILIISSVSGELVAGDTLHQVMRNALVEVFCEKFSSDVLATGLGMGQIAVDKTNLSHVPLPTARSCPIVMKREHVVGRRFLCSIQLTRKAPISHTAFGI